MVREDSICIINAGQEFRQKGSLKISQDENDLAIFYIDLYIYPWKKIYDKPRQFNKSRDITANKGPSSQSYGFSSSHVWM